MLIINPPGPWLTSSPWKGEWCLLKMPLTLSVISLIFSFTRSQSSSGSKWTTMSLLWWAKFCSTSVAILCPSTNEILRSITMCKSPCTFPPDWRSRTLWTPDIPGVSMTSLAICLSSPAGAVSSNASIVRLANRQLAIITITATAKAARGSAYIMPNLAKTNPTKTTRELRISLEKWSASASSAWLLCFLAARFNARDLEKSTTIEMMITRKLQILISKCSLLKKSRSTASLIIQAQVTNSKTDSIKAEKFSTLAWP